MSQTVNIKHPEKSNVDSKKEKTEKTNKEAENKRIEEKSLLKKISEKFFFPWRIDEKDKLNFKSKKSNLFDSPIGMIAGFIICPWLAILYLIKRFTLAKTVTQDAVSTNEPNTPVAETTPKEPAKAQPKKLVEPQTSQTINNSVNQIVEHQSQVQQPIKSVNQEL